MKSPLDRLIDRGVGWTDIAAVVGVPVSTVRSWWRSGGPDAESSASLEAFVGLLDALEHTGIEDPAAWMETYLLLPSGYCIRPVDLYAEGHSDAVLGLAAAPDDPIPVLNQYIPRWWNRRSDWEVFIDTDGQRSIRLREDN